MKVTKEWINEFVDRPGTADEMVQALESAGFPCEEREALPGGDERMDFEVTSNRGDCMSVVGLAREFASATGRELVLPPVDLATVDEAAEDATSVENLDLAGCPYYSARIIRGVKVGPSPEWLRLRLEGVGLRSVNNVVDATNWILYALGQPLHAFDFDKLEGRRIVVRWSRGGETMVAIDGSKLTLDESMLVIADQKRPVAVAGVMGGLDTEVSETTRTILLEAAAFDHATVRATSRRLGLMSDSSRRFERGINPATVAGAADRAAALIRALAGGEVLRGAAVAAAPIPEADLIAMRPERCRAIAGVPIPTVEMMRLLDALGFEPTHQGEGDEEEIVCTAPPHRLDVSREIDLIEEVIRLYGFANIPPADRLAVEVVGAQPAIEARRRVNGALAALGFHETVTFSFVAPAEAEAFLPSGFGVLAVQDDRRKAEPVLRPSLIPSLLRCRKRNQDAGHRDVRLFEEATCFGLRDGEKLEQRNLSMILDAPDRQAGLRSMRAAIEHAVRAVFGPAARVTVSPAEIPWFDPGASLVVNGEVVGTFGLVRDDVQRTFDLLTPVVAAELALPRFYDQEPPTPTVHDPAVRPAIQRDLSIVLDEPIAWSKIEDVVAEANPDHLEGLEFVGIYRGPQVGPGRKSVTFRLTFRDPDRTLRHEEVDPQVAQVVERLARETGAVLRA